MIGLPKGQVFLVPWTDTWQKEFLLEKKRIESVIGKYVFAIHHVGSTSIQGLSAKPIIDIAIEIHTFNDGENCAEPLKRLNYAYRGTHMLPNRHYFSKGNPRTHQIHMHQKGDKLLLEQLAFRDYLIQDETARLEYEDLKQRLVKEYQNDRPAYTAAKSDFIRNILKMT